MECTDAAIPEVKILVPKKFGDNRGYFAETYNCDKFAAFGASHAFVQDNQSLSVKPGVLRGLHYQIKPKAQDKLVRVLRGAILDVAVDIRRGSPTFGKHVAIELSADNGRQLFIPAGFAHGFVTLVPETEVFYKVSDFYSPEHERGILWNDPALGINWGIGASDAVLSDKDLKNRRLADMPAADLF